MERCFSWLVTELFKRGYFFKVFVGGGLIALLALPAFADQDDPRLDKLFQYLQTVNSSQGIQTAENLIWEIWTDHSDSEINQLMIEGIRMMRSQNYSEAVRIFTQMTETAPHFAEGWNKRATVYYLQKNYDASLKDIETTLALEPRHFGALSGQGLVFIALEKYSDALKSFQAALKVHPHMEGVKQNLQYVRNYLSTQTL